MSFFVFVFVFVSGVPNFVKKDARRETLDLFSERAGVRKDDIVLPGERPRQAW